MREKEKIMTFLPEKPGCKEKEIRNDLNTECISTLEEICKKVKLLSNKLN